MQAGKMTKRFCAAGTLVLGVLCAVPAGAAEKDIEETKGSKKIAYDISPANSGTNIAVGKDATVFIGGGTQEAMLSFGETVTNTFTGMHIHNNTAAKENLPEGIAVGTDTYARTGSIQIGGHTLGKNAIAIGDTTADQLKQFGVAATTLGTNSYTGGGFATTLGSYNVQSSPYAASGFMDTLSNATKNAFATVVGTLNSNESMTGGSTSGVANVINGVANQVKNSNGTVVMGAGNQVENSSGSINASAYTTHFDSVTAMQESFRNGIAQSAGGATLVLGGANTASYTRDSQIMGVGNRLTGTSAAPSRYNFLDGYQITGDNLQHVSILGYQNTAEDMSWSQIIGDNRKLSGANSTVLVGSADSETELNVADSTILGYNANSTVTGGVALGYGSLADRAAGSFGWDPETKNFSTDSSPAWRANQAALSLGRNGYTRQITNVAAGTEDTDAVNVAQLKKSMEQAGGISIYGGDGISIEKNGSTYVISANITGGTTDTDITHVNGKDGGQPQSTEVSQGRPLVVTADTKPTTFAADTGSLSRKPGEILQINGDENNIETAVSGSAIQVKLKDDLNLNSVTVQNSVSVAGGPVLNQNGVDANHLKITNVADGTSPGDAVNYGQLQQVENKVDSVNSRVDRLGSRINKVGAGAAALAALHPQDFDPEDKWNIAAGFGSYRSAHAMALGAFYRPDYKTMFSVGGSMGNGENLMNVGLSLKLGKGSPYSGMNRQELLRRVSSQDAELADQKARIAKLETMVQQMLQK